MPDEELLKQQKQQQLEKTIRVGSSHKASDLKQKDRALYNTGAIEQDISNIDDVLANKERLELKDEEEARLTAIRGRNLSTLLLLQEKTFGDSTLMKNVKMAISNIEVALNRKKANAPFNAADVEYILTLYSKAILTCRTYLRDKSPTFSTGLTRYDQVKQNLYRLRQEAEDFMNAKELLATGVMDGKVARAHELLVQSKVYSLGNGRGVPQGNAPVRNRFDERNLKPLGPGTNLMFSALSGKETPSNLIMRLSKSRDKNEKQLAGLLPAIFVNLQKGISEFREGKVASKFFLVGDTLLSLSQNAYGQLTLSTGRNYIPLERGSGILADMMASDIIKNREIYGKKAGENIIRNTVMNMDLRRLNTEKRQIMTDYLVERTGASSVTFSNFSTNDLAGMVRTVLRGKRIHIVRYGEQIKVPIAPDDVVFTEHESHMINITEAKELMEKTTGQQNREKVRQQVSLQKKEEKPKQVAGNKQEQEKEKKKEREWDKRESKIKNLLGDIMFSYETWDADNQVQQPGVRLRNMIIKNQEAVAELVADLFRRKGDQRAMINGIVDQMPLFAIEDDEKVRKFKTALTDTLNKITDTINAWISEKAFFAFGEWLGKLEAREQEEEKKKLDREFEAAQNEAKNKKSLEKSSKFTYFLKKAIQKSSETAKTVKNKVVDVKDDSVKMLTFLKTNAILKHLTNPEALIAGNKTLGIPGIEEIIRSTDIKTFKENEERIDESVEEAADSIQKLVGKYSKDLFKPSQEAEEELPNINEPGISEEELRRRKRERIRIGNERLNKRTKDSLTSGEAGQGLFIKNVFEKYFMGVATIDKRSMLASMIRNSRPVGKLMDENDPNINPDAEGLSEEVRNQRREEKRKRREYNEKLMTEAKAGYLGGLLKGAGPLFQKMMQGLPINGMPEEMKGAIEDMKSRLAPIPDEIVEAQLNSIVENSHKQIKNIKVLKSLGAASVGQTFLCKLTRSDGTEEEVAIKLLKPDVRNRMMRERKLMIECARQTDITSRQKDNEKRLQNGLAPLPELKKNEKGGMQVTYEGQLKRIEEELDLTIEARNVELGKIYDKVHNEKERQREEKVVSVKLNSLVAPTTNSMVLEKAPGETLDSLLKRIGEETKRLRDLYRKSAYFDRDMPENKKNEFRQRALGNPDFSDPDTICEEIGIEKYSKEYEELRPVVIQQKLCGMLAELKKKKAYLETYAYKWTKEGVFEEGFYHGDPHDGNIMISDEKLTVIDFGNCTKLTEEQQVHITRMMAAACIGDMKTFRHGFHMLLKPEFENLYQEKREELGRVFTEIFSLGNRRSSGSRIAVALLEAQKLGLEIPPAVFNFSQGQMRLQNALENMNRQIEETQAVADFYNDRSEMTDDQFDFTEKRKQKNVSRNPTLNEASESYTKDLMAYCDTREDMKRLIIDYTESMREIYFDKFRTADASFNTAIAGLQNMIVAVDLMPYANNDETLIENNVKNIREAFPSNISRHIALICDPELVNDILECLVKRYKSREQDNQKVTDLIARLDGQRQIAANTFRAYDDLDKKMADIRSKHNGKWEPTGQEQTELDGLMNGFLNVYFPFHIKLALNQDIFKEWFNKLEDKSPEKRQEVGLHMSRFFRYHPQGSEEFMAVYNDFIGARNEGLEQTNPAEYKQKRDALANAYLKVMAQRIKEKDKLYDEATVKQDADFFEIITDVMDEELSKVISRMGYIDSIVFNWKYKSQKQEDEALRENNNNGEG